jgi:hypothetical protein
MDFRIIFQIRDKKFWWMDVIFYFVISLLIATVLCYFMFLIKNSIQRADIEKEIAALETVGTEQQKEQEKEVISYQKKIIDFTDLFSNHEFASNTFAFMQKQTMPNIWFKQFVLDRKNSKVQLSGESDDMEFFSRQVASFEKNEYVKNVGVLNSTLGESARVQFNFNLALDPKIFAYIADASQGSEDTVSPSSQPVIQPGEGALSNQNLITIFHLLLTPEVAGTVDHQNHTIVLNVPQGTDVENLKTSIIISSGAAVAPESGAAQDFSNPVVYRVTAQDGSVQDYTATVNILSGEAEVQSQSKPVNIWAIVMLILIIIAVISVIVFFAFKKFKKKNAS